MRVGSRGSPGHVSRSIHVSNVRKKPTNDMLVKPTDVSFRSHPPLKGIRAPPLTRREIKEIKDRKKRERVEIAHEMLLRRLSKREAVIELKEQMQRVHDASAHLSLFIVEGEVAPDSMVYTFANGRSCKPAILWLITTQQLNPDRDFPAGSVRTLLKDRLHVDLNLYIELEITSLAITKCAKEAFQGATKLCENGEVLKIIRLLAISQIFRQDLVSRPSKGGRSYQEGVVGLKCPIWHEMPSL